MSRGPYAKVAARNAELLERIRALKAGYRRVWAHLRYVDGNQKRIHAVMKAADLLVKPNLKLRPGARPAPRSRRPIGRTSGGAST